MGFWYNCRIDYSALSSQQGCFPASIVQQRLNKEVPSNIEHLAFPPSRVCHVLSRRQVQTYMNKWSLNQQTMRALFSLCAASIGVFRHAHAISTTYWLDNVSGYDYLPSCVEGPLSSIVRGMVAGCGRTSSYSCFCTASSEHFQSVIANSVATECGDSSGTEVASASAFFHQYCLLRKDTPPVTASSDEMST